MSDLGTGGEKGVSDLATSGEKVVSDLATGGPGGPPIHDMSCDDLLSQVIVRLTVPDDLPKKE